MPDYITIIRRAIIRLLRATPNEDIDESAFMRGVKQGHQQMRDRFDKTGSMSPHWPISGWEASGAAVYTREAKRQIAEQLRRKADEIHP